MSKVLTAGMNALFISILFGAQALAQGGQAPQQPIGKSLSSPEEQDRANRAMSTPSGQMGRDEPTLPLPSETKDVPPRANSPSSPGGPNQNSGQHSRDKTFKTWGAQ